MTPARAALAATVLAATTVLGGCGSADLSPHTNACRSFQLEGGSSSPVLTTDMIEYLAGDAELGQALVADAKTIRAAAVDAGLTRNLGEADYQVFKTLIAAIDKFVGQLAGASDTGPVDASVSVPVQKAVKAVEKRCA